jgi:hypothetical protein
MVLESPWRQPFDHVCFIDTPGYNPGSTGTTVADDATTAEALRQADALLWIIGLDANGEISSRDLDYLTNYAKHLPKAVVLNKADTRPESEVWDIMEQIQTTLDLYGIEVLGISAFSSVDGGECGYLGEPLAAILETWNRPSERERRLCDEALAVIDDYIRAFEDQRRHLRAQLDELHSLKLDLHELGLFDDQDSGKSVTREAITRDSRTASGPLAERHGRIREASQRRMDALSELFDLKEMERHLNEAKRLRTAVVRIFG